MNEDAESRYCDLLLEVTGDPKLVDKIRRQMATDRADAKADASCRAN